MSQKTSDSATLDRICSSNVQRAGQPLFGRKIANNSWEKARRQKVLVEHFFQKKADV